MPAFLACRCGYVWMCLRLTYVSHCVCVWKRKNCRFIYCYLLVPSFFLLIVVRLALTRVWCSTSFQLSLRYPDYLSLFGESATPALSKTRLSNNMQFSFSAMQLTLTGCLLKKFYIFIIAVTVQVRLFIISRTYYWSFLFIFFKVSKWW